MSVVKALPAKGKLDVTCRFFEDGKAFHADLGKERPAKDNARKIAVLGDMQGGINLSVNIGAFEDYERADARMVGAAETLRQAGQGGADSVCWLMDGKVQPRHFRQFVDGALLFSYKYKQYKSKHAPHGVKRLTIVAGSNARAWRKELSELLVIDSGVRIARDLANMPGNDLAPLDLADFAKKVAKDNGMSFRALSKGELKRGGYVGISAVGRGSANPPVLFTMAHKPKKVRRGAKPLCLVGKGVTFDTGGISIKPWDGMWDMKADMGGSAAVIGAMQAIARLDLPLQVVGVVAAAENMPDGSAYRPGDILRYRNGRTVEIRSTDAEGRLVLADALLFAQGVLKQKRIVEFSTLTGACVRALGNQYIGLLSRSAELAKQVKAAADLSGEAVWELPMHLEYRAMLKSPVADIRNGGGPLAGASTAGWFLHEFIQEGTDFVHLDIAGVFLANKADKYWSQPGATGAGVRIAVRLAQMSAGGAFADRES
ncbi:leucyl aminopeptidase [bacterium]|nr:leucyl aminopeptidase [bacterium]